MNGLKVQDFHGKQVIDSRDVAVLVKKRHNDLLRDIRGYIEIMDKSIERKIAHNDFFIESSFKDSIGRTLPCYLLTKKGCDMVANKMTGEKGVLFTAAYVTAFEKMQERIQKNQLPPDKAALAEAKLNNSRARLASAWMKIARENPVPEYKSICAHYASAALAGRIVLPLPEAADHTYSATEVGELLGGLSAKKVGMLANEHKLKSPEYGVEVWDKSRHSTKQVLAWRYNEKAVEKLREIMREGDAG